MYTVLPSPLLHAITGLRFQPLVDLHSGQAVAHEVLVEIHNVNLDALFASLPTRSALQIFFWQANTLLQMPDKGQYWLNLPADQLLDAKAIDLLLALRHQQRLTIEIQDPLRFQKPGSPCVRAAADQNRQRILIGAIDRIKVQRREIMDRQRLGDR